MKKKILILIIIVAIAIAGVLFFVIKKKKYSPLDKMYLDVMTPNTPAGMTQRNYLVSVGGDPNSEALLKGFVDYRASHPEDAWTKAYNKKQQWGENEIVNI
jgi:LPS O-antigen subunit length determinant protein (WzzB/FepE family)